MARKKDRKQEQAELPDGVTLRRVSRGHSGEVYALAVTPDGRQVVSGSQDKTLKVWDLEIGSELRTLSGHSGAVWAVAVTPDGRQVVSGSGDKTLKVWDLETGSELHTLSGHSDWVNAVAVTPDGRQVVSGSADKTLKVWDLETGSELHTLSGHSVTVFAVAVTPDGRQVVSGSGDKTLKVWDLETGSELHTLSGHSREVYAVAVTPDGRQVVSGSGDQTLKVWDLETGVELHSLEAQGGSVAAVAFATADTFAAKVAQDDTIRIWNMGDGAPGAVASLDETNNGLIGQQIAFSRDGRTMVSVQEKEGGDVIRVWDIDLEKLLGQAPADDSVPYVTARFALVGGSGVGKTGLGYRLAHGVFKEHSSTHGQQFWPISQLGCKRGDGAQCEAVLWDLAGQPDYRIIHALFLEDVDVGLLLFDPTHREKPLAGVEYWLQQLNRGASDRQVPRKLILVGARTDRGVSTLSEWELTEFCREKSIEGGYLPTSASKGDGVDELLRKLGELVPWDEFPTTITTKTFKQIKDQVLALKESAEQSHVVLSYEDLQRLLGGDSEIEDIRASVQHLSNHGYVHKLRRADGQQVVLLKPDLLVNVTSSIVLEARRHARGLGLLDEAKLLAGGYSFPELEGLPEDDREALLDAAASLFLDRHLAFRESVNDRTVLIAPALINEKRPSDAAAGLIDGDSYRISGAIENVYASLVVQLGYTEEFERDQHRWQKHAQFGVAEKQICGFSQTREDAGEIEIALYSSADVLEDTLSRFQTTFERFLRRQKVEVDRIPSVACPGCKARQRRSIVLESIDSKAAKFFCSKCGFGISTPSLSKIGEAPSDQAQAADAAVATSDRRTAFEEALVWVKAFRRDRGDGEKRPSCFISYAWGVPDHERWVLTLARDLQKSDVEAVFDKWHCPPGSDRHRFVQRIVETDYVAAVGTPLYLEKYNGADRVVEAEITLMIDDRLMKRSRRASVLPLLLKGSPESCFPPLFRNNVASDFNEREEYFLKLFELILSMHKIPFDHPRVEEFVQKMSPSRF